MGKVYFGIDLGTSGSSISYLVEGRQGSQEFYIEPVTVKFQPAEGGYQNLWRLPSVVMIEKKGSTSKIVAGFPAQEAAAARRAKPFQNLFLSAKSDMGTLKVYEDSIHPDLLTPVDVSAAVIAELVRAAERETGADPRKSPVVITVPASFTHSQRQDTLEAARKAGLEIDDGCLLDEPVAAFIHTACHQKLDAQIDMKEPKNILIFDLGAGTCDVSVFEASYERELLATGIGLNIRNRSISNYERLGGDNIDLHIVENAILPVFCEENGMDFRVLPERVKREIRYRLKFKARQIKEEICRRAALSGFKANEKQSWSIDGFPIPAINARTKKTGGSVTMQEFLDLMGAFTTDDVRHSLKLSDEYRAYSFFGPVINALDKAEVDPVDLDAFIFNGGSSHNPFVREAFEEIGVFGRARFFDTPDLDLSVSKGAAIHCYHLNRNGRSLVTPIVNSDIGIYTNGVKREKLVEAGTELPFPDEGEYFVNDRFCVPQSNMKAVAISLYSGRGTVIGNLSLPLPIGTRKGEPVCVGLKIDRNKVMSFTAYMKNAPGIKIEAELRNPWSHRADTAEDQEVNSLWAGIAELRRQGKEVAPSHLVELAKKERLRENYETAIEILQRLEDKGKTSDDLFNILAICYGRTGLQEKALEYFKKAVDLSPDDPTYLANYASKLISARRVDEAISFLKRAADEDQEGYFAHYWLGYAYREKGDEESAVREFTRCRQVLARMCEQDPDDDWHLEFLRDVTHALGEYAKADELKARLRNIRHSRVFNTSPENLIGGPDSGIWKEDEIFEDEEETS